jgi:hypothetical protein
MVKDCTCLLEDSAFQKVRVREAPGRKRLRKLWLLRGKLAMISDKRECSYRAYMYIGKSDWGYLVHRSTLIYTYVCTSAALEFSAHELPSIQYKH